MKYEYWLACIRPLAGGKKERLRSCAGSGEAVYNIEEKRLEEMEFLTEKDRQVILSFQKKKDLAAEYDRLLEKGIRLVPCHDTAYPRRLRECASWGPGSAAPTGRGRPWRSRSTWRAGASRSSAAWPGASMARREEEP